MQTNGMAERDRGGIATMFAANPQLKIWPCCQATLRGEFDQLANAVPVQGGKGIGLNNALGPIICEKADGIVTAYTINGLG